MRPGSGWQIHVRNVLGPTARALFAAPWRQIRDRAVAASDAARSVLRRLRDALTSAARALSATVRSAGTRVVGGLRRMKREAARAQVRRAAARRRQQRLALQQRIGALETIRAENGRRIAALEGEMAALRGEHAALQEIPDARAAVEAQPADASALAARLRRRFPDDRVHAIRRGTTAVDVRHEVRAGKSPLAVLLYHVTDDPTWRPASVRAARRSAARHRADVVLVVSRTPAGSASHVATVKGIAVVRPLAADTVIEALRRTVVDTARALEAARRRADAERRRAAREQRMAAFRGAITDVVAATRVGLSARVDLVRRQLVPVRRPGHPAVAESSPPTVGMAPSEPEPWPSAPTPEAPEPQPQVEELPLPDEPVARALALEARAQRCIAGRDAAAAEAVLDAARAFLEQGWRHAAIDLLLQRLATGAVDREVQLALLDLARSAGQRAVADDGTRLLAQLLRLDGRKDAAQELESQVDARDPSAPPA